MERNSGSTGKQSLKLPPDDLQRVLTLAQPDKDERFPRIGVAGGTYTILLTGNDTNGRFCLIDCLVPPGGGPPPHRHDFEETFIILEGEVEATFRGNKLVVRAGDTLNIPSNAPHEFHNRSNKPARLLCICSPAGLEDFFMEVGTPVDGRTTPAPEPDMAALETLKELALKYRIELLKSA